MRCDFRLFQAGCHQAIDMLPMLGTFTHGIDHCIIRLHLVIDTNTPTYTESGIPRQINIGLYAGRNNYRIAFDLLTTP